MPREPESYRGYGKILGTTLRLDQLIVAVVLANYLSSQIIEPLISLLVYDNKKRAKGPNPWRATHCTNFSNVDLR